MNAETTNALVIPEVKYSQGLQLCPITVNAEYKHEWNERSSDFICLTLNGKLLRETLYRVGGINTPNPVKDEYFMLLKHVEAFYPDNITKDKKRKPHLEYRWCILDKFGNEKVEFQQFQHPYLVDNSCIYSIDSKYYNVETGELYCQSFTSMKTSDFLFLENKFDDDKSKRGVLKIHKTTGKWELFQ